MTVDGRADEESNAESERSERTEVTPTEAWRDGHWTGEALRRRERVVRGQRCRPPHGRVHRCPTSRSAAETAESEASASHRRHSVGFTMAAPTLGLMQDESPLHTTFTAISNAPHPSSIFFFRRIGVRGQMECGVFVQSREVSRPSTEQSTQQLCHQLITSRSMQHAYDSPPSLATRSPTLALFPTPHFVVRDTQLALRHPLLALTTADTRNTACLLTGAAAPLLWTSHS